MTNPKGRFGMYGGQYIPETLMNAVIELEEAYEHYKKDPDFQAELAKLFNEYAGRPSRLYFAEKMTVDLGGPKIYLKREDLNHTGAHKINNVLGQALLAKKMGKTRLIAPTSAGRIAMIASEAKGFIYLVSSLRVTGTRSEITTDLGAIVKVIRENTSVPCAIGFGISNPEQAKKMADIADGAIVGSAIIKIIAEYGKESPAYVGEFTHQMKSAL